MKKSHKRPARGSYKEAKSIQAKHLMTAIEKLVESMEKTVLKK